MHVYINVCLRYFHMHQYIYNRKNLFIYLPINVIQVYNPYNTGRGLTCIYCIACKYIFWGNKNYVKERIGTVNLLGRKMNIFQTSFSQNPLQSIDILRIAILYCNLMQFQTNIFQGNN